MTVNSRMLRHEFGNVSAQIDGSYGKRPTLAVDTKVLSKIMSPIKGVGLTIGHGAELDGQEPL